MAISSKTLTQDKCRSSAEQTLPFKSRKKIAEAMVGAGVAVVESVSVSSRLWTRQGGAGEQCERHSGQKEQAATKAYIMRAESVTSCRGSEWTSSKLKAVVNGDGQLGLMLTWGGFRDWYRDPSLVWTSQARPAKPLSGDDCSAAQESRQPVHLQLSSMGARAT